MISKPIDEYSIGGQIGSLVPAPRGNYMPITQRRVNTEYVV